MTGLIKDYDIIVVGAGIAGSAAAYSLGQDGYQVLVVERDLSEPDRIVGELLQPGGIDALVKLGMEDCVQNIGGIWTSGYTVIKPEGESVLLTYPNAAQSIGFHHGRFVQELRKKVSSCKNVTVLEGTVTKLLRDEHMDTYIGVQVKIKGTDTKQSFYADLNIVADGCFSAFRKQFIDKPIKAKSHFAGFILKNCNLPSPNYGHVILAKPSPILLYQIDETDTRILIDIPDPMPKTANGDMEAYMREFVGPQLPKKIQPSFYKALDSERLRSMPCSWLPPAQNISRGVFLVGDAMNMRHPLTGGGMSVALWDIVEFRNLLRDIPDLDPASDYVLEAVMEHHWNRKHYSSVINILANALYALFSANDDPFVMELQNACFAYFKLGGSCADTPVGLLAGLRPEPMTLIGHFFAVALYGMLLMWARSLLMLPVNIIKSFLVLWRATVIILPLIWAELVQ